MRVYLFHWWILMQRKAHEFNLCFINWLSLPTFFHFVCLSVYLWFHFVYCLLLSISPEIFADLENSVLLKCKIMCVRNCTFSFLFFFKLYLPDNTLKYIFLNSFFLNDWLIWNCRYNFYAEHFFPSPFFVYSLSLSSLFSFCVSYFL